MSRSLAHLLALGALGALAAQAVEVALAAPSVDAVLAALADDSGWTHYADRNGVVVYEKHIGIMDMPAYKGVTEIDVDRELLFSLICDTEGHEAISDSLAASTVLNQMGERIHYYQIAETPALVPIADRYWFNQAQILRDVGTPGHHLRIWSPIDPTLYPEAYAAVQAQYPDAVYVSVTYGSWEVRPLPDGKTELTYRSLTNPGGNVPSSVFEVLSARTLPDNMMNFVDEARARAGG